MREYLYVIELVKMKKVKINISLRSNFKHRYKPEFFMFRKTRLSVNPYMLLLKLTKIYSSEK
jgi:hypothetical protein